MNLIDRITQALAGEPPHGLLPGDLVEGHDDEPRLAAVLIAITDRPEPGLILTLRRADMRTHAGQVAFPGGRIDEGEDARAAALREAHEELGARSRTGADDRRGRHLSYGDGLWRNAGRRHRPARSPARAEPGRSRRLVRGAA